MKWLLAACLVPLVACNLEQGIYKAPSALQDDQRTNDTYPAPWDCDIRAWVRAPDLQPGATIPAEVRVTMNGSMCGDIKGWSVGLQMKERGLLKVKAPGVVLPIKPEWDDFPVHSAQHPKSQRYGDYSVFEVPGRRGYGDGAENVFQAAMDEYHEVIKNPKLWTVHAQERVVFDLLQPLSLDAHDPLNVDIVKSFYVHVPNTNFPPTVLGWGGVSEGGNDNHQIISHEELFEYYVLFEKRNGDKLELAAGKASFIPKDNAATGQLPERETSWPQIVHLDSNRVKNPQEKYWRDSAPACDKDNLALFTATIEPTEDGPLIPGQDHSGGQWHRVPQDPTLHIGSEIQFTWAIDRMGREAHNEIAYPFGRAQALRTEGDVFRLAANSERDLEEEREHDEEFRRHGRMTFMIFRSRDSQPARGHGSFKFDQSINADVYELEVVLPIVHNIYPAFEKTLYTRSPTLRMRLHTRFSCLDDPQAATSIEEDEWTPYALPIRREQSRSLFDSPYTMELGGHDGVIPINLELAPLAEHEKDERILHYLDPLAEGPIISLSDDRPGTFPRLDQTLVDQDPSTAKRHQYALGRSNERLDTMVCQTEEVYTTGVCWTDNEGGAWRHTAKLWQRKLAKERSA